MSIFTYYAEFSRIVRQVNDIVQFKQLTNEMTEPTRPQPTSTVITCSRVIAVLAVGVMMVVVGCSKQSEDQPEQATVTIQATQQLLPTHTQSQPEPTPTMLEPTPVAAPAEPIGRTTGILGFNINGQGYTLDVDCALGNKINCDPTPVILPTLQEITPSLGHWSPDGQRIAFITGEGPELTTEGMPFLIKTRILIADYTSENLVSIQINPDDSALFSDWFPDSNTFTFVSGNNSPVKQIWLADADCLLRDNDTCLEQITNQNARVDDSFLSPDASKLIFSHLFPNGTYEYYLMDITNGGAQPRQISAGQVINWHVDSVNYFYQERFAPDPNFGEAYVHLYTSDFSKPLLTLTTPDSEWLEEFYATLSPDGRNLAINMTASSYTGDDLEIYLLDLACMNELENDPFACERPEISGASSNPYLIQLTDNDVLDGSPAWSPDSKWLAYLRDGNVFLVEVQDLVEAEQQVQEIQLTMLGNIDMQPHYFAANLVGLSWQP